ncbi:HNH endonuclease signature motif containing protein [Fusobacterium nucleatum]|uniref:HNH endonuclease signature motif containing protein n=1 Tax=Fusobacterium vincentii TaxID=155615 RepID=UPI002924FF8E|nr:HNH endonuclease signature motif containing protein [Fusobacterium nucleatum]BEP05920.1 HNH endonuclease signature motif containing protein [Fusobacterium nucleatum]
MKKYTDDIIDFLREIAPGKTYKEIVEIFNKKYDLDMTTKKLSSLLGRKKIKTGTTGCFRKGFIPWNKGKKGYIGANKTSFKKGNKPKNWRPIGSERINDEGYTLIKVSNEGGMLKRWALKHRVVWEQHHKKKIPKGSVIIFADGNKNNLNIENLICVTRNELKVLNRCRLISSVPELTKTGLNVAKLKIKLEELRKEKKD